MRRYWFTALAIAPLLTSGVHAQDAKPAKSSAAEAVTTDNFPRAETDRYFAYVAARGGFGKFFHTRALTPIGQHTVIRPNRDTIYSSAIFDLDAGPVTITLPDAGKRFLSLQVIDEDHHTPFVAYGGGRHVLTRENVGARYVTATIRLMVDPAAEGDLDRVHALQNAITVSQPGGPGTLDLPAWDKASLDTVRNALLALGATLPDMKNAFGARGKVDPVRHLIGSASAWGGNPDRDATYLNVTPERNDGKTEYLLTVGDVPVDAFWSVSVYNAAGRFEPGLPTYTLNDLTAKRDDDGKIRVRLGTCQTGAVNCLSIMPGWNYMVRLYRPRAEILDGRWTFPAARPVTHEKGG